MPDTKARGELHGCIVCGKLYQLYVVHDTNGNYIGSKVMSAGGREVTGVSRPLVACEKHNQEDVERAVQRTYGKQAKDEE